MTWQQELLRDSWSASAGSDTRARNEKQAAKEKGGSEKKAATQGKTKPSSGAPPAAPAPEPVQLLTWQQELFQQANRPGPAFDRAADERDVETFGGGKANEKSKPATKRGGKSAGGKKVKSPATPHKPSPQPPGIASAEPAELDSGGGDVALSPSAARASADGCPGDRAQEPVTCHDALSRVSSGKATQSSPATHPASVPTNAPPAHAPARAPYMSVGQAGSPAPTAHALYASPAYPVHPHARHATVDRLLASMMSAPYVTQGH
ncbi:hypothetical protein MSPP1_003419 [Malassezia sp. CBS 17886]|nr:hypothetical protein MSPP1_003419 [Malassezia sp. CBS 17886]